MGESPVNYPGVAVASRPTKFGASDHAEGWPVVQRERAGQQHVGGDLCGELRHVDDPGRSVTWRDLEKVDQVTSDATQ